MVLTTVVYDAANEPVMTSINYSSSPFGSHSPVSPFGSHSPVSPFVSSANASTVVFSFLLSTSGEDIVTLCVMNGPVGWEQSLRVVSSTLDPSLSSVELVGASTPTVITSEAITAAMYAKGDALGIHITNDVVVRKDYIEQENPVGTSADNPIEYAEGTPLINNAFYRKDGKIYVWMDKWVEWTEAG